MASMYTTFRDNERLVNAQHSSLSLSLSTEICFQFTYYLLTKMPDSTPDIARAIERMRVLCRQLLNRSQITLLLLSNIARDISTDQK